MTFLTQFLSINPTEIIFINFQRKNYLTTFPGRQERVNNKFCRQSDLSVRFMGMNLVNKNVINGVKSVKICILWCFSYISQLKSLYQSYFTKTSLTTPRPPTFFDQNDIFPNLRTPPEITRIVATLAPLDFFILKLIAEMRPYMEVLGFTEVST